MRRNIKPPQLPKPPELLQQNVVKMERFKVVKEQSVKVLIAKLDKVFSLYIRNKYADENGIVNCYTCNNRRPVNQIQCGHFFSRRHYSIRWEENNCRPQCAACNVFNQGRQYEFGKKLIAEIGQEEVDKLEQRKNNKFKLERFILEELIKQYSYFKTK